MTYNQNYYATMRVMNQSIESIKSRSSFHVIVHFFGTKGTYSHSHL